MVKPENMALSCSLVAGADEKISDSATLPSMICTRRLRLNVIPAAIKATQARPTTPICTAPNCIFDEEAGVAASDPCAKSDCPIVVAARVLGVGAGGRPADPLGSTHWMVLPEMHPQMLEHGSYMFAHWANQMWRRYWWKCSH